MDEEQRGKLTDEQVTIMAQTLNDRFDIPRVPEWAEGIMFKGAVMGIDYFLLRQLGDEIYDLIADVNDGIDDEADIDEIVTRFATIANNNPKLKIPFVNEQTEQKIFYTVIHMFIAAMRKGKDINRGFEFPDVIEKEPMDIDVNSDIEEENLR
jgi:hypothetical protein